MAYIEITDFDKSIYPEIKNAIAKYSEQYINHQINFALSLIESRLSTRYDIQAEFQKTGADRNALLITYGLDIAIYNLYSSQEAIPDHRVKRYDDAIEFLQDVVGKKANIAGLPALVIDETNTPKGDIKMGSNPRRANPSF